ncbi:hypothetical protein BDV97DRAFT_373664 [Delphinella strobiligena]|nr:hypothetical protein BDV97DRAFT_373664 [Delphinella strobiligena]
MSTPKTQVPVVGGGIEKSGDSRTWNTRNIGLRLAADGAAAATAGVLVAPVITMIDKAIIENASGRNKLVPSLQASLKTLALRPHGFFLSRPFALIFMLYTGTYLTANTLDTVTSTLRNNPATTTTAGPNKFVATSATNLSLCLYKDSQFTRLFGAASSSPRPVGLPSYALFAARDCMTIFASFNLPPLIAPYLPLSPAVETHVSRISTAQFVAPAALQLLSTPLHLLGLDLYNRNAKLSLKDRARVIRKNWLGSAIARMGRIVPAFGVGGVVNAKTRDMLMLKLE